MKFLLRLLIPILFVCFFSCEEEPLPAPEPDVKITGSILNASDQSPLSGIVLNTLMGRNVRSQLSTDTEGKFTFEIEELRQYFIEGGMSEADADTLLAQDEIYLSLIRKRWSQKSQSPEPAPHAAPFPDGLCRASARG